MLDSKEGYLLEEVIPGFLKAGNISNGKVYTNDTLRFINEKYAVVEKFDDYKVIDLETKKVILTDKVLTIVGDVAVLSNGLLYDLTKRSIIQIGNYTYDSFNNNIIVLKDENGKYQLFNTTSKQFIHSLLGSKVVFVGNGKFALINNDSLSELIDLENDQTMMQFHGNVELTDNSIKTYSEGLYLLNPFRNLSMQYGNNLEVHGMYGISKNNRIDVYDLFTNKLVFHKKNKADEKIEIANNTIFISGKRNTYIIDMITKNYSKIPCNNIVVFKESIIGFNDKKGAFILYDVKNQIPLVAFEGIIYYEIIDDIIILLTKEGNECYLFDTLANYYTCLPYSSLDIERFGKNILAFKSFGEVSTIYAPSVIDKYGVNDYDNKRIIDVGLMRDKNDKLVRSR